MTMMKIRLAWMSRRDRRLWRSASTVAELGELMALWLEGEIASRPGYAPGYGPADETAGLIPSMAALNRAGFVTTCSHGGSSTVARARTSTGRNLITRPSSDCTHSGSCTEDGRFFLVGGPSGPLL